MVGSLRILSRPSEGFHSLPLTAKDIYVDFGVWKPHTVPIGRSRRSRSVANLKDLRPRACRIFIEDSCPKNQLYGILSDNRVFTVRGRIVNDLRERSRLAKSDSTNVSLIRELANDDPGVFREITAREKDEIIDEVAYSYHHRVGQTLVAMKNRQRAFLVEFGEPLPQLQITLRSLGQEKRRAARAFRKFEASAKAFRIRGLGPITIAGILVKANPQRFHSLSSYLRYCGLKASSKSSGKYSRHTRALYHQLACDVVMHRDSHFYPFYQEIKARLAGKFPDFPKYRLDGMAKNRIATLLAKRLYQGLKRPA